MIKYKNNLAIFKSCLLATGLLLSNASLADDTEIYFSSALTDANPNIMFVLDVSGSMDTSVSGTGKTRFEIMKSSLQTVIEGASSNVNVGMMNYGEINERNEGQGVKFPITHIDALASPIVVDALPTYDNGDTAWLYSNIHEPSDTVTVRSYLSEIADWYWRNSWYEVEKEGDTKQDPSPEGYTQIVDALFEAALYYRGEQVTFGASNARNIYGNIPSIEGYAHHTTKWAAHPSSYHGTLMGEKCGTTTTSTLNRSTTSIPSWYKCPANSNDQDSPGHFENCEVNQRCDVVETTAEVCENSSEWVQSCGYNRRGRYRCEWNRETVTTCNDQVIEENFCDYDVCDENQGSVEVANYKTPITESCQSNYIILLTDGVPTYIDPDSYSTSITNVAGPVYTGLKNGSISPLSDKSGGANSLTYQDCEANPTPSGYRSGICGPELTQFLSESDNSNLPGDQPINTFAIGFGLSSSTSATNYLKSLVTTDDPDTPEVEGFFAVDDEDSLSGAFIDIIDSITATTSSFASPGYSIDLKNGIHNEDYVYIPVFDKQLAPRWNGNLKKFKLTKSIVDGNTVTSITDKFGNAAVSELGVFEDSAVDFWSTATQSTPDGKDVVKGGVSSLIDPVGRTALTDVACGNTPCTLGSLSGNEINISNVVNGGSITNTVLGLDSSATQDDREKLVNFMRGRIWDVETSQYESIPHVGDMLHTEPVIVTYNKDHNSETPDSDGYSQQVIYAATNEGYLHAFDTKSGNELFSFMPSSLMKNIKTQYDNSDWGNHAYGVDGIITTWVHDENDDGVISSSGGDQVLLYFGLRRGGREYYALDVTDPKNPKLQWKIDGATDTAFATLGQTWSTPYLAKIRVDASSAPREVAIFSGGYDTNQDNEDLAARAATDSVGNDIFIVDAKDGALLWSAQNGGTLGGGLSNADLMTHSIPGGVRILDMNADGAVDRMYFADTAGQVFRLELPIGPTYGLAGSRLIKFADLGGSDSNPRMFFNEPDVALFKSAGRRFLSVSIGTGYRAHPANMTLTDRFYVLIDGAVDEPLETELNSTDTFTTLTEASDLVEITATGTNAITSINEGELTDKTILELTDKSGWYFVMPENGEKVLSTSITAQGKVLFTTLVPQVEAASSLIEDLCEAPQTQGRYYSMNILTGTSGSDLDGDGTITDSDLMLIVSENEIPNSPQQIFNEPVCSADECTQMVDIRVGKRNSALEEQDVSKLESVFWSDPEN